MNTSQSRWPPRLMWISVVATAVAVLLDRAVVFLVDTAGPAIAVPGGQYGDDDITDRSGDFVDVGLAVIVIVVAGLAWAIRRTGSGRSVLAGIVGLVGPALLVGACFFTPLFFNLTPQPGRDELTFGQAPGPYWYLIARPAVLGIAAVCLLLAVVGHAFRHTPTSFWAPQPRAVAWMVIGMTVTGATVTMLLGLHVLVAVLAGLSPLGVLLPLAGVVPALAASVAILVAAGRGRLARAGLVTTGTGAGAVLWIGTAIWLLLRNHLVIEPSPMDDEVRRSIEPWAGPLLLVVVGLVVLAQVIVLLVTSRRDVGVWLLRDEPDQQAMAPSWDG